LVHSCPKMILDCFASLVYCKPEHIPIKFTD
jgi:hypothetical protein